MMSDPLSALLQSLRAPQEAFLDGALPVEPEYINAFARDVQVLPVAPLWAIPQALTVAHARALMRDELDAYTAPGADHSAMLLVKVLPGVGKTTAAVGLAERLARTGKRVLYCGPRHNFFGDLMQIADDPGLWYEWLPRQTGEDDKVETCPYAAAMAGWLARGYPALEFCKRICGWDIINGMCVYHDQKRQQEPIIFGQHQHLIHGHPLSFDVAIGDESPIMAFCHEWEIPGRFVMPQMDLTDPLAEVLHDLQTLALSGVSLEGPLLLTALGGAARVQEAAADYVLPLDPALLAPPINTPAEVEKLDYAHLFRLVPLLVRETKAALAGEDYPHRVVLHGGNLLLLLRHRVHEEMPAPVVWLDATANEHLYRACFDRPARLVDAAPTLQGTVYQVTNRANGKGALVDGEGAPKPQAEQLATQVRHLVKRHGYQAPAVISFMGLIDEDETFAGMPATHFYAARGTNVFEDADALIVAGTPQPHIAHLEKMARMLFFERMAPFKPTWSTAPRAYHYVDPADGSGRAYPTSGFWHDPDLQAVLWSLREAEIVQAAHRCRPVNHAADIWLLTNLPIDDLPPARLLSLNDLFDAPLGVNVFTWDQVLARIQEIVAAQGMVTLAQLVEVAGVDAKTARTYFDRLEATGDWERALVPTGARGRPPRALKPKG